MIGKAFLASYDSSFTVAASETFIDEGTSAALAAVVISRMQSMSRPIFIRQVHPLSEGGPRAPDTSFILLDITETRTPEKRCEFINLALKSQSIAVNVCKEPIKGLTFFSSHFFQNVPEHDLKTYGGWMATQLKRSNLKGAAHHSEFRKQLGHLHLLLLRQPQRSGYSL
jgi:hypothetical protein